MKNQIVPIHGEQDLPKGINRSRMLPDPALGAQWDSIVMDDRLKKQLLSQAVLNFSLRAKVDEIYAKHTSQPIETIERDMDRDRFMSAEEAKAYGLIDTVFSARKDLVVPSKNGAKETLTPS